MSKLTDANLKKLGKSIKKVVDGITEETPHTRIAKIKLNEAIQRLNQEVEDRAAYEKAHGKKSKK